MYEQCKVLFKWSGATVRVAPYITHARVHTHWAIAKAKHFFRLCNLLVSPFMVNLTHPFQTSTCYKSNVTRWDVVFDLCLTWAVTLLPVPVYFIEFIEFCVCLLVCIGCFIVLTIFGGENIQLFHVQPAKRSKGLFTSSESKKRIKNNQKDQRITSKKIFAFAFAFVRCQQALRETSCYN